MLSDSAKKNSFRRVRAHRRCGQTASDHRVPYPMRSAHAAAAVRGLVLLVLLAGSAADTVRLTRSRNEHAANTRRFMLIMQAWHASAGEQRGTAVPMKNYLNTQYMGEILVGTPRRKYAVVFDTGSANFWVYGNDCPHGANCDAVYSPETSSTAQVPERCCWGSACAADNVSLSQCTWTVEYGGGGVRAHVVADDVLAITSTPCPRILFVHARCHCPSS